MRKSIPNAPSATRPGPLSVFLLPAFASDSFPRLLKSVIFIDSDFVVTKDNLSASAPFDDGSPLDFECENN
jgi:hypothetical protein